MKPEMTIDMQIFITMACVCYQECQLDHLVCVTTDCVRLAAGSLFFSIYTLGIELVRERPH